MNSPSSPAGIPPLTLRDRVAVWRELLDQCGRKPTRKRVHALRVVTLRIQAELENDVAELPHASHQAQEMLRFSKLAEKLRRALGPVREIDVWIGKLQRLRASLSDSARYVPRSTQECSRQIERLEERLRKKRRSAGQKLVDQIAKRRRGLAEVGDDIDQLESDRLHGTDADVVDTILKQLGAVNAEFPSLNEENLHDFRKSIKKVRYLAEIHAETDPVCGRIAAQMKKLQSAIGEWHDWQALARTTRNGRRAKAAELQDLLDSLTGETLETALATSRSVMARMLEMQSGPGSVHAANGIRRKPPVRNGQMPAAALRKLA